MKERLLKLGMTLFLIAIVAAAGVYPVTSSQAAAKATTYQVVIQKGSPLVALASINNGTPGPNIIQNEGTSFQMVVGTKLKTEKVKSTGGTASYYEVTIPKKSFKAPTRTLPIPGSGMAKLVSVLKGDAKGKFYISGGDVDISQVQGAKKLTVKIGDGNVDPDGSLSIPITTVTDIILESTGKVFMKTSTSMTLTTGQAYITVKGSKSKLEGKALPNDDTTKSLPNPLVGQPLDLDKMVGTLVGTTAVMNSKNKITGVTDTIYAQVWVMKITK